MPRAELNQPFNLDIYIPPPDLGNRLPSVISLDTFEGHNSKNFHPQGLYSVPFFGVVGTPARDSKFAFIDQKIPVIHPLIYKTLIQLKSLYKEIITGKEYARFDEELGDFVRATPEEGSTGYTFFVSKIPKLKFEPRPSVKREINIELFEKYKNNCMIDKYLVVPAGYRDLEVDSSGRVSSDEVNALYQRMIAISNTINFNTFNTSPESYDQQRVSLQNVTQELYEYFFAILEGKKGLMYGKWMSRRVFNGTRNVISAMHRVPTNLDDIDGIGINDTAIGLYQVLRMIFPVAKYRVKNGFLSQAIGDRGTPSLLTNKKTLMSERVEIDPVEFSKWMTDEGIEKLFHNYKEDSIRHMPIVIDGYYLGLTYRGPDGTFKFIHGIDDLPDGRNATDCQPITYTELFYQAIYDVANNYPTLITRYPIAGAGSIYPSMIYLLTTIKDEVRVELDDQWRPLGNDKIAKHFPINGSAFFNSMSPHTSRLPGLSADFDGDTSSANGIYSDEAIEEIRNYLNSWACYVDPTGKFTLDTKSDTITYVTKILMG